MLKNIVLVGVAFVIAGGLIYYFFFSSAGAPAPQGQSVVLVHDIEQAAQEVPLAFAAPSNLLRHNEPKYGFSFSYPSSYHVGGFSDESGDTLLLQNAEGVGLQLYITPFDEDIALTPERIKADLPDLDMREVQTLSVGAVQGIEFKSSGGDFGQSAELWFVRAGYLYQFSTYAALAPLLQGVSGTLSFP